MASVRFPPKPAVRLRPISDIYLRPWTAASRYAVPMHPRFSIEVDRPRDLVMIVLTGLFMPEDMSAFLEARRQAHAKLACAPGQHITLTDLRSVKIMSQEMVDAWCAHLTDPNTRVRRLAFLVAPTLVRSQLVRALAARDQRNTRVFQDSAEAKQWLLGDDAPQDALSRGRSPRKQAPPVRDVA